MSLRLLGDVPTVWGDGGRGTLGAASSVIDNAPCALNEIGGCRMEGMVVGEPSAPRDLKQFL